MQSSKSNVEELQNSILNPNDKIIFAEASNCFLNSLNRAAYIMAWISLIESLKNKILDLSDLNDNTAISSKERIEIAENNSQSVDKIIYEDSLKCGIIDNSELSIVTFLWQQRCIFAHPYNKTPTDEEVTHILHQVLKISLGKPLLFNKSYLNDLVTNISTKNHFLPFKKEILIKYFQQIIARTPQKLNPFLFKTLFFEGSKLHENEGNLIEFLKIRLFIIELLTTTKIDLENSSWSIEDRVTKFPFLSFLSIIDPKTWPIIPIRIKEMLLTFYENLQIDIELYRCNGIMKKLILSGVLEDEYKNSYFSKLDKMDFTLAINYYGDGNAMFNRLFSDIINFSYDIQNNVIQYIYKDDFKESCVKFNTNQQIELGKQVMYTYLGSNFQSKRLFSNILDENITIPSEIIVGISMGIFISNDNKFDYYPKLLEKFIKLLSLIPNELQNLVYSSILEVLVKESLDIEIDLDVDKFDSDIKVLLHKHQDLNLLNQKSLQDFAFNVISTLNR